MKFRWETGFKETEIGEIPRDWEVKNVKNVAKINEESVNKNYPHKIIEYIDINSVEEGAILEKKLIPLDAAPSRAKRIVKDKDVLLSTVRPNLRHYAFIKKANPNTIASTGFAVLRSKKIEPRFLYFSLTTDYVTEFLTQIAEENASTYPAFTIETLENLQIPYPPPEEQTRIATVLSWFDDLIENKRRQNEILEKTAMAIFKSWFIDFEPFQDEELVYSEELDMEIPKGWNVKSLSQFVSSIQSGQGKHYMIREQESNCGKGYPLWGANGILGYVSDYDLDGWIVLTGRVGTLGKVFISNGKIAISDNVLALVPRTFEVTFFIYLWLKTSVDFESLNVGSTQPLIRKGDVEKLLMLDPPQPILQRFHSLVEPIFRKTILNQKQILTLKKIRDTLLPQLVFGRLRVESI